VRRSATCQPARCRETGRPIRGGQPQRDTRAHEPEGRGRRTALAFGDLSHREWARGQMIGLVHVGGGGDDLADAEAEHHFGHLLVGIRANNGTRLRLRHEIPLDGGHVRPVYRDNDRYGAVQPRRELPVFGVVATRTWSPRAS
jgi:hypothetical protein